MGRPVSANGFCKTITHYGVGSLASATGHVKQRIPDKILTKQEVAMISGKKNGTLECRFTC